MTSSKTLRIYASLLLLLSCLAAPTLNCGKKDPQGLDTPVVVVDTIPPAAIEDILIKQLTSNSFTFLWSAPGDDADIGTASHYDMRYSSAFP
ncbi:MAG: hypothetical protein ABIA59_05750 [Candidatus Latescibacterota bacterium]